MLSDAGTYSVEVTGNCGVANSSATLTLGDPATCLGITTTQLVGSNVIISFTTTSNEFYRVDRSDDLGVNQWVTVADHVPGTGGVVQVTDVAGASHPSRFYRIALLPPGP